LELILLPCILTLENSEGCLDAFAHELAKRLGDERWRAKSIKSGIWLEGITEEVHLSGQKRHGIFHSLKLLNDCENRLQSITICELTAGSTVHFPHPWPSQQFAEQARNLQLDADSVILKVLLKALPQTTKV
jgi:hypothetical protein